MIGIIKSILAVAMWIVPLFVGFIFILRNSDSYSDSYRHSYLKGFGFNFGMYKLFFRLIGLLFLALGVFLFWYLYLYEPISPLQESKDFWDSINKDGRKVGAILTAIAIPARMSSTRFPGKALALLKDKPVLEWVYRACKKSQVADDVFVLTDSVEIAEFCENIQAKVIMTSPKCESGTERIIEAIDEINADFIVNVQGDEPFISTELIDEIFELYKASHSDLITAVNKISDAQMLLNENVVKVLRDSTGKAIYFSRNALPYIRGNANVNEWLKNADYWKHIGIYGYSRKALAKYEMLSVSQMEKCEMLEQLRFINAGYKFEIVQTNYESVGIDTPADLIQAQDYLKNL